MTDRDAFDGIRSATILRPGDRVLIDCGKGARRSDVDSLLRQLKECFPGVVFFVMGGAQAMLAAETVAKPACTCPQLDVTAMGDKPSPVKLPSYDPNCPAHS